MTQARKSQISLSDTPYYHCISRCVRRAYLCGVDKESGKDYTHRKEWIIKRLQILSKVYVIDICAYAVMDNHYHLVLKVNREAGDTLSDDEVIERWMLLFHGDVLINRYIKGECHSSGEINKVHEIIATWRHRLSDISWFMRSLNEYISRKANEEDNCKGHFWESRFKSQALLNEQAVLSCMVYVDLNPIRAGLSDALDESEFTSIQQRINDYSQQQDIKSAAQRKTTASTQLVDFTEDADSQPGIPYSLKDYFELADWTGRAIRKAKRGYIPAIEPKLINKLGIDSEIWLDSVKQYHSGYHSFIGSESQLKAVCENLNVKWLAGISHCRRLFQV